MEEKHLDLHNPELETEVCSLKPMDWHSKLDFEKGMLFYFYFLEHLIDSTATRAKMYLETWIMASLYFVSSRGHPSKVKATKKTK